MAETINSLEDLGTTSAAVAAQPTAPVHVQKIDAQGRASTFTGTSTQAWAGGVLGEDGTLAYAIQGNLLAGSCVVPAAEAALVDTPGDLPERLMAAMEAARDQGGDGRCSCTSGSPTSCGCPPPSFAQALILNATVVPAGPVELFLSGTFAQPRLPVVTALDGMVTSNMAIVSSAGAIVNAAASGRADLVLDYFGYFSVP